MLQLGFAVLMAFDMMQFSWKRDAQDCLKNFVVHVIVIFNGPGWIECFAGFHFCYFESSLGCCSSLWFAERRMVWVLVDGGDTVQGRKRQLAIPSLLHILNKCPTAVQGQCQLLSRGLARWWISPTKMCFVFAGWEMHCWWLPASFWLWSCIFEDWIVLGWVLDQFWSIVWGCTWVGWAWSFVRLCLGLDWITVGPQLELETPVRWCENLFADFHKWWGVWLMLGQLDHKSHCSMHGDRFGAGGCVLLVCWFPVLLPDGFGGHRC